MVNKEMKLKATDLRIGNIVEYGDGLTTIDINILRDWERIYKNSIKPIPLTEEWLLKFGFEKIVRDIGIEGTKIIYYKLNNFVVFLLKESFEVELIALGEQFNLAINPNKEVHIFQNLHFALTGKELN